DEVEVLAHRDQGLVEAALAGVIFALLAQVPLAEHAGDVASRLETLGEGDLVERKLLHVVHGAQRSAAPVEAVDTTDGVNTGPRSVLAAQQGCPRRLTIGAAGVAAGEAHPLPGQAVNVWRLVVFAAVTGHVGVAEVVGKNEDDIRGTRLVSG